MGSRKYKFLLALQAHKLWFTLSCSKKKSHSILLFFFLTPSLSSECCFPALAAIQAWAGDCRAVTRTGQFVSNLTPTYWLPHTRRLETACGVTSPSECHVSMAVHLLPWQAVSNTMFSLFWVHRQDGISALSTQMWWKLRERQKAFTREWQHLIFMLCIGADDSAARRQAAQGSIALWQKEG